jgi:hypothetical protein
MLKVNAHNLVVICNNMLRKCFCLVVGFLLFASEGFAPPAPGAVLARAGNGPPNVGIVGYYTTETFSEIGTDTDPDFEMPGLSSLRSSRSSVAGDDNVDSDSDSDSDLEMPEQSSSRSSRSSSDSDDDSDHGFS